MKGIGWACGAVLAALLALGASVQAQDSQPPHGRMFDRFASADANGDGAVTREEAQAARAAAFSRIDGDHDGFISEAERNAQSQMMAQRFAQKMKQWRGPGAGAALEGMDADHDGEISRAEFLARPMPGFDRLDGNHNGVVEASEMAAARSAWAARRLQRAPAAPGQAQ
jgi:hypothetical protein